MRAAEFAQDFWPQLMSAVSTAGMTVTGALLGWKDWSSDWTIRTLWILFSLFILLNFVGIAITLWRGRGVRALEDQFEELSNTLGEIQEIYTELFEGQLAIFSGRVLGFEHSERISVYRHERNQFSMVGRYSENPEFSKKPGRTYPDDVGVICKAWQEGMAEDDVLPDYDQDEDAYLRYQTDKWGLDPQVVRCFNMKSRNYVAFALKDPVFSQKIAVIVFESIEVNKLSTGDLSKGLETTEGQRIVQFLNSMRSIEPRLLYASQEDL